ncbi:class I SAM-dependent methyltransferase [Lutimonas halocynthiae]|uniref:THUMP-like domain-containing protein n=1 Tax=Lutimonas halocynthiae TaxID=1446477 RepID=UPI0025B29BE7|nr:class I SAM-dependent methyltransferase [Lutimonas halocynthiae]MDN3644218.1 class I SAM-dependent methyltransferase [Lutimonas halocynthiae]
MNNKLLHKDVQQFIDDHLKTDLPQLIFKGSPFADITIQELAEQILAKSKSRSKLPTWFATDNIYYPKSLSIEQTSSELTAEYKSSLIAGDTLIDLTGGFGVDSYCFSKKIKQVTHCELDAELSKIAADNFKVLAQNNVTCLNKNGIEELAENETVYDWIYADPSRRNELNSKVFKLEDCLPDIGQHLGLLLKRSDQIMIKLSPLLDISLTIKSLNFVKEIHIIAVKNEVKELLILIENKYIGPSKLKTINIVKNSLQTFEGYFPSNTTATLAAPKKYLYEPNAAILKSGLFNEVSSELAIDKLNFNSHLYTSERLIEFPGRRFHIESISKYNKKLLKKKYQFKSANITTRNFHDSVAQIRKKTGFKDGGNDFLFFTTDHQDNAIVIHCRKV